MDRQSLVKSDSPTAAVKMVLQWMIGQGLADNPDVIAYYKAHSPTSERAAHAAGGQMRRRLVAMGYIEGNRITRAGRRAAQ